MMLQSPVPDDVNKRRQTAFFNGVSPLNVAIDDVTTAASSRGTVEEGGGGVKSTSITLDWFYERHELLS